MAAPKIVETPDHDLDLRAWLAEESKVVDRVTVKNGGSLKIVALTEGQFEQFQKAALKADPTKGRAAVKFDSVLFKQLVVANSLAEANDMPPAEVLASLKGRLAGDVVAIFERVAEISGFDTKKDQSADLESFFA